MADQGLEAILGGPRAGVIPGNTDLTKLPIINNPDGSYSTLYGTSFHDENPKSPTYGKEVLVRGILGGKTTDDIKALKQQYYADGKHLGVFNTPQEATAYSIHLHNAWANGKLPGVQMPKTAKGILSGTGQ